MQIQNYLLFFFGVLATMLTIILIQYIITKNKGYFYLLIQIIGWFGFYLVQFLDYEQLLNYSEATKQGLYEVPLFLAELMIFETSYEILNLKQRASPIFKKTYFVIRCIYWLMIGLQILFNFILIPDIIDGHNWLKLIAFWDIFPVFLLSFSFLVFAIEKSIRHHPQSKNIVLGLLSGIFFNIVAIWVYKSSWQNPDIFYLSFSFYASISVIAEIIFFVIGVTYSEKQIAIEFNKTEKKLAEEIEHRRSEQYEAIIKSQQINEQIGSLRMQALRSQMNPHFIFNALNSIRGIVQKGENKVAENYLSKFGKLLRMILESSDKNKVQLSEEIVLLKLYIEVEALRFGENFNHEIIVNADVDLIKIPPLLIQPYVENAIFHGLIPKEGPKNLKITITELTDYLEITIEDNGIGRNNAQKSKLETPTKHKSMGTKLSYDRLKLLGETSSIEFLDLIDSNNCPIGTRVKIKLPI